MSRLAAQVVIPHNRPTLDVEEEQAALRVLRSAWLAQGREVAAFEDEFCAYLGLPPGHAVAVSSGSAALFLALHVLDAKGKTVAFPAYACSSLRHAVALAGAQECLLDIADEGSNVDVNALKQQRQAMAIVPHLYGLPVDLSDLPDSIQIIEDCAQALGARVMEQSVGLQGKVGVFSFYATKLMTSGGQGGMVVSTDRALVDAVRDYIHFDQRQDDRRRFNFQMTDLQAAIGRVQLKKLPMFLQRREEIFQQYQSVGLPMLDVTDLRLEPVRFRGVLKTTSPTSLLAALVEQGIRAIVPLEEWEILGNPQNFPNAQRLARSTVSLPLYPTLSKQEVAHIVSTLMQWQQEQGS
jgi:perosamine synthetase